MEGAMFALLGLLLAFTFYGAAARFDARRMTIAEEANDIGTAYLRVDMLAPEDQAALRPVFRQYADARIEAFRKLPDLAAAKAAIARSERLQQEIWSRAVRATWRERPDVHRGAHILLLPAINDMIDITTTRSMGARIHPPRVIFALLAGVALVCALLAGRTMGATHTISKLHLVIFVFTAVFTVYTILEIEYPRAGLLRLDAYDQVLVDLRASMK
jgi:hypothetical protein